MEHHRNVPIVVPSARRPRIDGPILERVERQRSIAPKARQHVSSQRRVLSEPHVHPLVLRSLAPDGRADTEGVERTVGRRQDAGDEQDRFVERAIAPQKAIEVSELVSPEAAPQNEQMIPRHDVGRVQL